MGTSLRFIFFLTFLTLIGLNSLSAQSRQKRYVAKVYTLDRRIFQGILESADDKGIYLTRKIGDTSQFINALQIREIKLRAKGKSGTGTLIGFISGLAIGGGTAVALQNDDKLQNTLITVGAVLFTFTTTAIGGAISSRPDEVIHLSGRIEDYLQRLQHIKSFAPKSIN